MLWLVFAVGCAGPPLGGDPTAAPDRLADTDGAAVETADGEADTDASERSCEVRAAEVATLVAAATACDVASDCMVLHIDVCPLGCDFAIRPDHAEAVREAVGAFVAADCSGCDYECHTVESVDCDDGSCVVRYAD